MPDAPPNLRLEPAKALLFSPDADVARELSLLMASALPAVTLTASRNYPSGAVLGGLAATPGLRLCLVDVSSGGDAALAFLTELSARAPGLPAVAVLARNDPDLILRCLRQGANEFLIRPFTTDQIQAIAEKLKRDLSSRSAPEEGARVFCIMPVKGACGATTLACNLGFQLKRILGTRTLLADMDPLTGTLAFLLKLKSSYSFLDALSRAANLDADLWKAIVTPCQGLDVLLSPDNPIDGIAEGGDPTPVLHYSRQIYGTVIIDVSGPYGDWNLSVANLCDELLVVTTNELPALHAAQRAMAYLEDSGLPRTKMRVLLNRYSPQAGLPREQVEAALHKEVLQTLPSDHDAVHNALLEGKPVVAGSKLGKSLGELAGHLAGRTCHEKKGFSLSRLFGR